MVDPRHFVHVVHCMMTPVDLVMVTDSGTDSPHRRSRLPENHSGRQKKPRPKFGVFNKVSAEDWSLADIHEFDMNLQFDFVADTETGESVDAEVRAQKRGACRKSQGVAPGQEIPAPTVEINP